MTITSPKRLEQFSTSIFTILDKKKYELLEKGQQVYNLSIGTPDFLPAQHIIDAVCEAAKDPNNYKYAINDLPELIAAVASYYKKRFNVTLEENEIMSLYGSQEGITHIGMALCDVGDTVLVPNPGYQIFSVGPFLSGCKLEYYPLLQENDFVPDLSAIPNEIADKAKFMMVSYPSNPVCRLAPKGFYDDLIRFAKLHNLIIIHDNAYSDIIYDGAIGGSFLSHTGAKDVGIELFSLSKSFNYTGARVSFAVGNTKIIKQFKTLRSQIDYGTFLPVQYGAIAALTGPLDSVKVQQIEYEKRRNALCDGLTSIGWPVEKVKGTMFVWARIPSKYTDSNEFVIELMEKTGVICVPGSSFGSLGNGYVRFALVLPVDKINELIIAIDNSGILK